MRFRWILPLLLLLSCSRAPLTSYVDPRIGSEGLGRVFVGPSHPFGMVKPSPDCTTGPNSGWLPMPERVDGFAQTHVSGTGGGPKYGNILIMPFAEFEPAEAFDYRMHEEIALGYYATTFQRSGIGVEVTTAPRASAYLFHYPAGGEKWLRTDLEFFLGRSDTPGAREAQEFVDAFVDIAEAGIITGRCKNIDKNRQAFAFGAGTKKMYDFLDDNPQCMSVPVNYTNDIRTISALDNYVSINNCVDLDLYGQINSESAGFRQISGAGGQLDFVLGAYLSKGGKSFICCSSTMTDKKTGELKSRIVPTLSTGSIVTDTRANIHYLVTEYGKVNLKGLSTWKKAEKIISVAHPQFRDELIKEAEKMKIWRRTNKLEP